MKHYAQDLFQDHQFFIVETPTQKEIIIGHPASVRLGLIQVLCENHVKTVSSIKTEQTNNLFRVYNIDGTRQQTKWSSSEPKSSRRRKSSESARGQNEYRRTETSLKRQTEHPYSMNNCIQSNSRLISGPKIHDERRNIKISSRPLIQSMTNRVRELNLKYYLPTNPMGLTTRRVNRGPTPSVAVQPHLCGAR